MLNPTLEQFRSINDPILFRSNPPVNASIARWLVAQGWKPAELAPNWWAELDQDDDYVDGIDGDDDPKFYFYNE
uniref:Uncharacterized protein n=1 Tax=viral metagenome TaxID=1070528 RepID=A0A6M3LS01_9ZZZZ